MQPTTTENTMTTKDRIDYIRNCPRGTSFYCPALAEYGISRARAYALARDGFDVVSEDEVTISV